ncbi:S ribonuclease [Pyrus ussuriensis x Pyrus communis]|uniref:S ribonuclease n=1 Tax=Pyrus ussuriensis x Pyrus communis TaxID=2448454 RepID=A0A5N5G3J1_9ROSA|nr:S ribonuclease [Pyrus ussuriensis x Pyrus communis]
MAGNIASACAQPFHRSTRSQIAKNSFGVTTDDQVVERYRLYRVNSHPPNFNLSMVQEFYFNIPSNFPEPGGFVYVHGVIVAFDPSVICTILELDPSSACVSSKYNVATSQYHLSAYHHEVYANPYILLFKGQVSKSILKPFNRIWSDFIYRNVLGTSNNDNPTPESARILFFVDFKYLASQYASLPLVSHSVSIPSLSQTSLNPPSVIPETSLCPPKLVPQCPMDMLSVYYHIVSSSGHSSVLTAMMVDNSYISCIYTIHF